MTLYPRIRRLLFRLDAEDAHHATVSMLQDVQETPGALALVRRVFAGPALPTRMAGLQFANPVGLAAGFDKNAELVPAMAALGFGFVEVGTVTPRPQAGNPRPRMFRYVDDQAVVNRLGFNNVGVDQVARNLEHAERPAGLVVGANVGKNADVPLELAPRDYAHGMNVLYDAADYFTLNISSPNTKDLRRLHEPQLLLPLFDAVANVRAQHRIQRPVFLKVSPDATDQDLVDVAQHAASRGIGLMATNTTVQRKNPAHAEAGGLSGAPLKERAQQVAALLVQTVGGRVPVVGVGGISSPQDAAERMSVGVALVQVYTGLVYYGPWLVRDILQVLAAPKGTR